MSEERRTDYLKTTSDEYARIRERHAQAGDRSPRLPLAKARENAMKIDWSAFTPHKPSLLGVQRFKNYALKELADYIDWTPFFASWELAGRFPQILDDNIVGEPARALYADARKMLGEIIEGDKLTAHGVAGFWPANADGDDIILFKDERREDELTRFCGLRQQMPKRENGAPNFCLSDFVAPIESGKPDYIGAFAVTTGHGEVELAASYDDANDNYSSIMAKALADRFAEAFAEALHAKVRRELWGHAADEALSPEELIAEKYHGIRPAPGYPAQPDHTEKGKIFELLSAEENAGMKLTESYAMSPPASVSGLYFAHPQATYFGVGQIGKDQVADYAKRKGQTLGEAEKWLSPILAYEPD